MSNAGPLPTGFRLFLASQSPRRRQLLDQIGLQYSVLNVDVVEQVQPGETARDYVQRVANDKARAGWKQVAAVPSALVLAADTEVVLDSEVFGKPASVDAAARMLRRLSGRVHQVLSAVSLLGASAERSDVCCTHVRFRTLSESLLADYLASGEWADKAGAYAIQGRAAAFIERIEGSYSGVMGLPLFETAALLRDWPAVGQGVAQK